jgi:prephenate dehydrogenase
MKICVLGFGKMGSWFARELAAEHEVSVFDIDQKKYSHIGGIKFFNNIDEIKNNVPEMLINCVSLQYTAKGFEKVLPFLPKECILCDIASVKAELPAIYRDSEFRFVSLHPMFGPTFANLNGLSSENVVIISDSDEDGKNFFRKYFEKYRTHIFEYSFSEHDVMMAYSLTLPFVSSLVFSSCVDTSVVPGTTFKRHLDVARGLLAEDDFLLAEIVFNPHSLAQIEKINNRLNFLWHIIKNRDTDEAMRFFDGLRQNLLSSENK